MNLREYLFKNKITVRDFAKKIRFSETYVSNHIHNKRAYSAKLANAIERETKGELKEVDLLSKYEFELGDKQQLVDKGSLFYQTLVQLVDPDTLEKITIEYIKKLQAQQQEA